MAAREEAIAASRIRGGDTLAMYLATGKKKHDRVFWVDTAGLPCMVCWGKKKGGRSFKREELRGVEPTPATDVRAPFGRDGLAAARAALASRL